ncbi:YgjP-like metallopeptidase domain-containing protein [Mesomycoplasma lagogenitalium]|uniref:DUF45 domain-containing protein n=1 Tax=Mesomycoplasma lagogenitalium TaxID=171286 RepID=A0ABY8LXK5_9BACT|nr:YgjP-like metallopeptidase domain-containing protein [Mesomycoplasma lagogenitalium]WGI36867.1 DUF45 domain-containing protein [Mesomycoplasma lagogenitalium]
MKNSILKEKKPLKPPTRKKEKKYLFEIENQKVEVFFRISKKHFCTLKITSNKILVLHNKTLQEKEIETLLKIFSENIKNHLKAQRIDFDNLYFYFLGQKYDYQIAQKGQSFYFSKPTFLSKYTFRNNEEEKIKDKLKELLEREFLKYLTSKVRYWEKIMEINYENEIALREKNSTWGTNYIKQKKIIFSKNLWAFSQEIIESVIIHELSHCFWGDHSKKFWAIVYKFCPDYQILTKKLNKKEFN